MEQEHKEAVSKLSKEAQEADAKIMELLKVWMEIRWSLKTPSKNFLFFCEVKKEHP